MYLTYIIGTVLFFLLAKFYIIPVLFYKGKIDKKGVLLARRDNSAFIRKLYEKVIMSIFNRVDKDTVLNMIVEELNLMFTNQYSIKDFIITKSVGDIAGYKIRPLPTDPKKLEKRL